MTQIDTRYLELPHHGLDLCIWCGKQAERWIKTKNTYTDTWEFDVFCCSCYQFFLAQERSLSFQRITRDEAAISFIMQE